MLDLYSTVVNMITLYDLYVYVDPADLFFNHATDHFPICVGFLTCPNQIRSAYHVAGKLHSELLGSPFLVWNMEVS